MTFRVGYNLGFIRHYEDIDVRDKSDVVQIMNRRGLHTFSIKKLDENRYTKYSENLA